MFKKIPIPPSFSRIEKGSTSLLLHDHYKKSLLHQGIDDLPSFVNKHLSTTQYLKGRTTHPSVLIEEGKRMVIRQYRHGGLLRFLNRDLFLFGARSFLELSLTEEIRSSGIPTIQLIGAVHQTVVCPLYRAYLLSLEIPHAKNLVQYFQEMGSPLPRDNLLHKRRTIRAAGLLLQQFHLKGFFHRDLQLKNLIVAGDQVLIIDFDRSYQKKGLSVRKRIKNIFRLSRSVEKWRGSGISITRTDCWRFFLAYAGKDQEIRKVLRKARRAYTLSLWLHRIGWTLEKIARNQEHEF